MKERFGLQSPPTSSQEARPSVASPRVSARGGDVSKLNPVGVQPDRLCWELNEGNDSTGEVIAADGP
eukprot:CAMPEP_0181232742 /NCGR_PEP_ID=MMETSP1096-20121128/35918_1 /TAXON_ID=156174 ORGANISM="Chrysochromulina ericina, Strain CCMP281" /NCGR_SAMPLE_ID=MMETSP1096 /ASSEMBLY_ACC=CAM_ASM_000453 /LENGTH=66 /DNA_ID=CAMNT_0023327103 /DNA_START=21 /DNA_END=221 /DNA_ORIENTATION=+